MNFISRIITLVVLISAISCQKVVDVEVSNGGERLVVEAFIKWEKGTDGKNQEIKLTKSVSYFSENKPKNVQGAEVKVVKNDDNTEIIFKEDTPGIYKTNQFICKLNQSYTLHIKYNGKTYKATETMFSVPSISKVEQEERDVFGKRFTQVRFFWKDEANVVNFYKGRFTASGKKLNEFRLLEDRLTDGKQVFFTFLDEKMDKDTQVTFQLSGISQQYYRYMSLLVSQESSGNPFKTVPAQLKGNCKNASDPKEEVLGYFLVSEVATKSYMVK